MSEKVTFSREEIAENVRVPVIVEVELRHLVEERLKQCGIYYRIFSRVKTAESLERKFQIKEYNENKKIQDLVGVRVDLYFEDDLRICKNILENLFSLVGWSETEQKDEEFKPMKINGVFRLPEYLKAQISPETWNMCIDDTVEIQLKTVFFEGWHEIEHDMKYKGGDLWSGRGSVSRYFNSILATLELCDKSLVSLFENLGHDLYKEGNWAGMIKAHYRLRMKDKPIYPEIEEILDQDHSENNIGKLLYKTQRQVLIDELLAQPRTVPINANTIIALVNRAVIHDERMEKIFHDKDVFDDGNETLGDEFTFHTMSVFQKKYVFNARVNLSSYKYPLHEAMIEAARIACSWLRDKFGGIEPSLPKEPETFTHRQLGYSIAFTYKPEEEYWSLESTNVDCEAPGQIWVTEASCWREKDGRQMLEVRNAYATASDQNFYINRYFSCPMFYSYISDRIGIFDVRYLTTSRRIIKEQQIWKIRDLILSDSRTMPVCIIMSDEKENGWLDERWLEKFRVYDFTRMAGRYAHIYTCSREIGEKLFEGWNIPTDEPAVYLFKASCVAEGGDVIGSYGRYDEKYVMECTFDRHQVNGDRARYNIVKGGQAFYHKLLHEIRSEMIENIDKI
jgi:ppGpp synthetase/RelA/SpoT-type nucleotidyltranferase